MTSATTKRSLRLALLGSAAAVVATVPASATTVNSLTFVSAQPLGPNSCQINYNGSVTGAINDGGNIDYTLVGHVTSTGSRNNAPSFFGTPVGVTQSLNGSSIGISPTQRATYFVVIYEADSFGTQGAELARSPIPRATLIAAGGACRGLVTNVAPTNNAGPDQTLGGGGGAITLAGTANDGDGDPLTHTWTQVSGPAVTLSGANTLTPTFTAPAQTNQARTMVFRLTTTDGIGNPVTDDVAINIPAGPNTLPVADAGADRTITGGPQASLIGSATDVDNDPLTYAWTQISGTPVTFVTGPNVANPIFNVPTRTGVVQPLVFQLIANDGFGNSAPDQVTLTISANATPTVNAGTDITAPGGSAVSLTGTASDFENDPLTYQWTQTGGPAVTLSGANTLTPSFTAPPRQPANQILTFSLTANDGNTTSAPDTVQVTIPANVAPVANAGADATVVGGSRVTLAGAVTDGDNDPVSFIWTQVAGPSVALAGSTTANPSFDAPARTAGNQVLTFQLVGFNGFANSAPDTVDITVPGNRSPVAAAGADQTVRGGSTVTLNAGTSSDPEGDPLTYQWVQTAGPSVVLTGANTATPTFVAPAGGSGNQTLSFRVTVTDPLTTGDAPTDVVDIIVLPNSPPIANAGADQGPINTGTTVTLSGSTSTDPDGNPLTYRWTQVSGPTATLSSATAANPTFVAPNVTGTQNLVFQLIVNDGTIDSSPDTVVIAVRAVGTITVIQRVVGADGSFTYTSDVTALTGTIATTNGTGQRSASLVPAGAHTLAAGDARAAGYALTAISCNDSDSVVNLANRNVAIALSPNENLVCTFTSTNTRDAALTAISNFLTARNAALLSSQPELQRRLDRLNGGDNSGGSATAYGLPVPGSGHLPFSLGLAPGTARGTTSLGTVRAVAAGDRAATAFDIWAEATFASLDYLGQEGRFSVIYAGADYKLGRNVLVGGLVQFDRYSPQGTRRAGTASGHGWMAGPYVTARIAPNLYADLRAAWGTSDNTISPLGTYVDPFETSRALYSGSLIGQFAIGSATEFRPEIAFRQLEEKQKSYLDSFGVAIPGQTVGQGDISFRPRLQHSLIVGEGWTLRPFIAADAIYTYGLERQSVFTDQFRMRIEGGAELFSSSSFRAGVSIVHDGIGSSGFKSTGGRISVSFGF